LLTRGFVLTLLAFLAVRIFHVWVDRRLLLRRKADTAATEESETEVEPPSAMRVAAVTLARGAMLLIALGWVLAGWGFDVLDWLRSDIGRNVLASAGRMVIVVVAAVMLARLVQILSARYIGAVDDAGQPVHSNRSRTLVSMARNVALTVLGAIGVVEVLSEVGVNANALLAGAGVVGLAVGFGSQRLVQDLITGLFILLGDTVRVGDVVDLTGKAGVVEAISMRTITLRDYNGNVHTIPYSSIEVVTNMTKEFSFAVFDVVVDIREDADRVMDVLHELDTQLRREWPYRRIMLEPLEIAGVDQFRETSVLIKARSKVRAGEQWKVLREFNRRMKRRFDELGIQLAYPQRIVQVADEHGSEAPPPAIEARARQLASGGT
jgi:small conductance mechanosensitive channel